MDRASALIARAREESGLEHFGEESFREGLDSYVRSLDREARLTDRGAAALDGQIVAFLKTRLGIEDWYARHPEIDEQEIVAPLIGLGLPRTGSTALGCMLGEDPAVRSIRSWEASAPVPPPEAATRFTDPRIAVAQASLDQRNARAPKMRAMLPGDAQSPTECQTFMAHDFKSQILVAFARVPSYVEWLVDKADFEPTYRYVKRVLKLLQWRCPPTRWRLRNPSHLLSIDALDRVFPDARYYMTHRDVARVIPSCADLYFEMQRNFSDQVDKAWLGTLHTHWWETAMHRLISFRDAGHEARFFDTYFEPFQRDPLAVIAQLYAFAGEELTDEARAGMEAWRRERPRDKHGFHEYSAAEFGLEEDELRARFRFYSDRFDGVVAQAA